MKIKANDMKSCFNCRLANAFIIPEAYVSSLSEVKVECVADTTADVTLKLNNECGHWKKKG